jgi:hypothetical protein
MSKRILPHILPFHCILALALAGCGGGGGGDGSPSQDNTENTTDNTDTTDTTDPVNPNGNDITANIWMTSECRQDNAGTYYRSLYHFTSDSQVLQGWQDFQDSSCTTRADTILMPSNEFGTYRNLGSQILPDGAQGYGLRYTDEGQSYDGFFTLTGNNTLCFSTNITFRTQGLHINTDDTSPSVDYEHCLSVHSSASPSPNPIPNPNPTPNPNPSPSPDIGSTGLPGKWLLANVCKALDDGGSMLWIYQFTNDNRFLYAGAVFENGSCQGDGTATEFFELEPPVTYSYHGESTMQDGTQGHSIQFSNGSETYNGYFVIDSQDRLCVSYNLELTVEGSDSTAIDYEHCMVKMD